MCEVKVIFTDESLTTGRTTGTIHNLNISWFWKFKTALETAAIMNTTNENIHTTMCGQTKGQH